MASEDIKRGVGKAVTATSNVAANDGKLTEADLNAIQVQGATDLNQSNATFDKMIAEQNQAQDEALGLVTSAAQKQEAAANEQLAVTIQGIELNKEQARQDYIKEQSASYQDWQKQSNQYGANAEAMAAQGLTNTGFSESSQVAMYTAHQNRIAVARDSFNRITANYNQGIAEAKAQNNSVLAEIWTNAYQQQSEMIIAFVQQDNDLLQAKADAAYKIKQTAHANYMEVLKRIEAQNQFDKEMEYKNASLAESKRQHDAEMAFKEKQFDWQKAQAAKSSSSGGGGSIKKSSGSSSKSSGSSSSSINKSSSSSVNKSSSKSSSPTVDMDSVLALGYGPISASRLNQLIKEGKVEEYEVDGKLKYVKVFNY